MKNSPCNILIVLWLLFVQLTAEKEQNSSCKSKWDAVLKENVYTEVDQMPKYPGGFNKLGIFFLKHYHLPKGQELPGSLYLTFVVGTDGRVFGAQILNTDFFNTTPAEKEAIRVLNQMPRWAPGKCHSKIVPVEINFPIHF